VSSIDGLTGLRHHREVLDWLDRRIGDGICPAWHVALFFCDFDDFKGHAAGDAVLKTVAEQRGCNRVMALQPEQDVTASGRLGPPFSQSG